jgi:hypothetical protein
MDGQLLYTFLCLAATRHTPRGKTAPVEGMKLIAALVHRHGIPVTWIVDSQSVQESRNVLLQGHQECGDDVILLIDISSVLKENGAALASKAEEIVVLRQRLPEFILSEQRKIREMLPWAEVNVVAADVKTEVLIEILEQLDCIGLWGYCWREIEHAASLLKKDDGAGSASYQVDDRGCPWSFFYASRDHYNAPAQSAGGLVAVESTSLDLNAVFYSGNSRVFSPEPSALRISGLSAGKPGSQPVHAEPAGGSLGDAGEGIAYGEAILNEYLKNCSWNRFVIFVQQQPAYEMEYASYDEYSRGTIGKIADILDGFLREVVSNQDIQPMTLPQAVNLYKREFEYTESCYMAFDSIVPLHLDIDFYIPPVPEQKPPYPFTFFYYDRECQLIFREGQMMPIEIRNYIHPPFDSKQYIEKEMPAISDFRPGRDRDKLILDFEIESIKQMPFGLAIWDDHSMFSLVSTNARLVKWIGTYLLFIRMDLEEGLNRIEVSLAI